MDPALQYLLSTLTALLVAVLTAIITVCLSLRRFYSERWWELKATAYSKIVESLYHIKHDLEVHYDSEISGNSISEERKEELKLESKKGYEEIFKAEGIGAFVISSEVAHSLSQLKQKLDSVNDDPAITSWYEFLDNSLFYINKCLEEIRNCAKKDLKVE